MVEGAVPGPRDGYVRSRSLRLRRGSVVVLLAVDGRSLRLEEGFWWQALRRQEEVKTERFCKGGRNWVPHISRFSRDVGAKPVVTRLIRKAYGNH